MSCEVCGYEYCNSSHSCPRCARRHAQVNPLVKEHVDAGQAFGGGIFKIVAALFLHPVFAFVGFWLLGFGLLVFLAPTLGLGGTGSTPPPIWYLGVAGGVPLVLAIVLRKIVHKLMVALFVIGCATLAVVMVLQVIELRQERDAKATAPQTVTAPATPAPATPSRTAPTRATTAPVTRPPTARPPASAVERAREALREAANPNITSTPPGSGTPGKKFEGVDLRVCDMSLGGVEVCQRYCATLEAAQRPTWCH
ncbi:MAG: hypothetical protein KDE22_06045 [Rhodobacterales bacterium]|nr:hypothetical protein [Rhodobacterales bacterium]